MAFRKGDRVFWAGHDDSSKGTIIESNGNTSVVAWDGRLSIQDVWYTEALELVPDFAMSQLISECCS